MMAEKTVVEKQVIQLEITNFSDGSMEARAWKDGIALSEQEAYDLFDSFQIDEEEGNLKLTDAPADAPA